MGMMGPWATLRLGLGQSLAWRIRALCTSILYRWARSWKLESRKIFSAWKRSRWMVSRVGGVWARLVADERINKNAPMLNAFNMLMNFRWVSYGQQSEEDKSNEG